MSIIIDPAFHMWFSLIVTGVAIFAFVREKFPLEVTSIAVLTSLMLFGQFFPLPGPDGKNLMDPYALLAGFANPSLIAVLALLVMGQAMIQSEALRAVTRIFTIGDSKKAWYSIVLIFLFVLVVSAFMNNTPLVIIVIPLLQALASSLKVSDSRFMIPLSYVAILGGMTTLIGSSTNLLVSSTMVELGYDALKFFDFILPGAILAGIGFVYILFVLPRLLPERDTMSQGLVGNKKEFVAELEVGEDSRLVGLSCPNGKFTELSDFNDLSVKLVQRAGHLILPPFEDYEVQQGDILIVAATRESLMDLLSKYPGFLLSEEEAEVIQSGGTQDSGPLSENKNAETRVLAEIMITPASRMIDMSLDHANFHRQFGMIVLGIQRRAKVVRRRLGRIRLESGDVLLVTGRRLAIDALRYNPDFIVLSGSKRDLPVPGKAPLALSVFFLTIALAALGILSIPAAAVAGSAMMIATGCLNIRQATRAIDRKIFLLVGSMLALGTALQASGGADYIANLITDVPFTDTPIAMLSVLFLLVAIATNILSNNACAILFTPIAMTMAQRMAGMEGIAVLDWDFIFAVTVIFAANCSFASPIGYQTNLLVMGPGHYRFRDYLTAGVPLVLLLWVSYIFVLKYYFGV